MRCPQLQLVAGSSSMRLLFGSLIVLAFSCKTQDAPDGCVRDAQVILDGGGAGGDAGTGLDGGSCPGVVEAGLCFRVFRPMRGELSSGAQVGTRGKMWGGGLSDAGAFEFVAEGEVVTSRRAGTREFTAVSVEPEALCGTEDLPSRSGVATVWRLTARGIEYSSRRTASRCVAIRPDGTALVRSLSAQSRDFVWFADGGMQDLQLPSNVQTGQPVFVVSGFGGPDAIVGQASGAMALIGRNSGVFSYSLSKGQISWIFSTNASLSVSGVDAVDQPMGDLADAPAVWLGDGGVAVWNAQGLDWASVLDSVSGVALGKAARARRPTVVAWRAGDLVQIPFARLLGEEPWSVVAWPDSAQDGALALTVAFGDPTSGFRYEAVLLVAQGP